MACDQTTQQSQEIQASVKGRKGAMRAPKHAILADTLPLTPMGRSDKKALRAQFWGKRAVG